MSTRFRILAAFAAATLLTACHEGGPTAPTDPAASPSAKKVSALALDVNVALDVQGTPVEAAGTVTIQQFAVQGGQIVASGVINLDVTLGGTVTHVQQSFTTAATISATCGATTSTLTITLSQLTLGTTGLTLGPLALPVTAPTGTQLGDLICSLADAIDTGSSLTARVALLNKILQSLTTELSTVSLSVTGTVSITQFSVSGGQILLSATVDATVTLNGVTLTVHLTITASATVSAECGPRTSTLTLNLSQLSLPSLGLTVGPLSVTISAAKRTTLGQLICDVDTLLTSTTLTLQDLVNLLNQVLAAL